MQRSFQWFGFLGGLVLVACLATLPASAGIHYKATTTIEAEHTEGGQTLVEAWVEGESAKVLFVNSANPLLPVNSYLLTENGGKDSFLVHPDDKTYSRFDLDVLLKQSLAILDAAAGMVDFDFDDIQSDASALGEGEEILGLKTTRYRLDSSYVVRMKMLGIKRQYDISNQQEVWVTEELSDDPGFGLWMRKSPPLTGRQDLDEVIANSVLSVPGLPLRVVNVSTTTGGKRGKKTSQATTTTEVTEFKRVKVEAATFQLPDGYTETEFLGDASNEKQSPLKGLFGGG